MIKEKQKLPKWFNGECYTHGATVQNRFSGEECELNAIELSMYDFVIGASLVMEMGMYGDNMTTDLRKGLEWFRKINPSAYMTLLD